MKISIVGLGFVGLSLTSVLASKGKNVVGIDVDKNKALATKFQVRGVPTFMIFKKGKQVWRQAGLITKNELKQKISNA